MDTNITPALFIGHGSPMNIIEDNSYTEFLKEYSKSLKAPSAIVVISAHWLTNGTFITGSANPPQIYDFFGFPHELYDIQYAPKGLPELAHKIASDGIGIQVDAHRGIDHAAWAVIKYLYPNQDIPVLEISLDVNKSSIEHFNLGKQLSKYRKENILLIGSGNLVHNLHNVSFDDNVTPFKWAVDIDNWFAEQLNNEDIDKILNYSVYLPNYKQGIPTTDHFLPLLYTLGMQLPDEKITTIHQSIQNGSISMRSIQIS
jgi:4,5-DOPA dioxygenase extradiol